MSTEKSELEQRKIMVKLINLKATRRKIIDRTNQIVVGKTYFLSSFYDKDGEYVTILDKSTKINSMGWPSTVTYETIEPVGDCVDKAWHQPGRTGTCNASNLYENRADASHTAKVLRRV